MSETVPRTGIDARSMSARPELGKRKKMVRRAERGLIGERRPVSTARQFVTDTLSRWGYGPDTRYPLELTVSELVANALRHGSGVVDVNIAQLSCGLRLEVGDQGNGVPTVLQPEILEEGHRGLMIIEAVSARWGFDQGQSGKCVWAEFDVDGHDLAAI